ncbi:MAG: hypothetical protein GWN58_48090, partial [Anaerolineae bacterium]|nr:hypothetical protein [Anaerolineae bacterium]
RVRRQPNKQALDRETPPGDWLARNPHIPTTLRQINGLPDSAKKRIYRALAPPALLGRFGINPVTWQGPDGEGHVHLTAEAKTGLASIALRKRADSRRTVYYLELEDTSMNGINLN